jgi:carbonic anhydrase
MKSITIFFKLSLLAFLYCLASRTVSATPEQPLLVHHYFSKGPYKHVASWSYQGKLGPEHWGDLDPSYAIAKTGKNQSPINIETSRLIAKPLPELKFSYQPEPVSVVNNGHSIQHTGGSRSTLHFRDAQFTLEQYHLHAPSEHTVNGKHFDAEIHFVHKSEAGALLVVAVFVTADLDSPLMFHLAKDLPQHEGEESVVETVRNPMDFLPSNHTYYAYQGSLTTPPCTEGVQWVVLTSPLGVKPDVINRVSEILKGNHRPVQPVLKRQVESSLP